MYRKFNILLVLLFLSSHLFSQLPGYEIKITIEGIKEKALYLTGYYGDKSFLFDSAKVKKGKTVIFKSQDKLIPSGIYTLTDAGGYQYMDIFIDRSRHFSITSSIKNIFTEREFQHTDENALYFEFQLLLQLKEEFSPEYLKSLIETSPESLFSKYIKADFLQVEIPKIYKEDGVTVDTLKQYLYWKTHFFDYLDLTDSRLLRMNTDFHIRKFFLEYIIQTPENIIEELDNFIAKTGDNQETKNYYLSYFYKIFNDYNPAHDAVLVHLYDCFCAEGHCSWLEDYTNNRFKKEVEMKKKILPGQIVPPLVGYDIHKKAVSTESIKNSFIILWFWDPDCDDCVELTPQLKEFYDRYNDYYDLEIFAVSVSEDFEQWDHFIQENQLNWINVSYAAGFPNYDFVEYFDLLTTPGIYIINSEHKIIARQFPLDELHEKLAN